jgi:tellurite resistance protein TerC
MVRTRNTHIDPSRSAVVRWFRRAVPMTDTYHGQRFLVRRGGVLLATPLLLVLVLVEVTDVVFAVDSIPAIFAVTSEPFLVFTANAFALLGLRAMYFLLADLMHRFVYLKLGLALVLVWVGIKMALQVDIYKIPTEVSLTVIGLLIAGAVAASLWQTRGQAGKPLPAPTAPPFRVATADEDAELEPVRAGVRSPLASRRT